MSELKKLSPAQAELKGDAEVSTALPDGDDTAMAAGWSA